ncbi:hypothetical protein AADZ84_15140 [Colwelliaceae bacterium MEBiC 14330]
MRFKIINNKLSLSILLITMLMGCDHSPKHNSDYPLDTIVQLDETQNINQSVDLLLYFPYDRITNIKWQQTAGEAVTILARNSKVISFTPKQSGSYSFSVQFTLNGEEQQLLEKTIIVEDEIHKLTARLSHAALMQNKVSYRSEIQQDIDVNSLKWQQIAGPEVTLTTENSDGELAIFFDAPVVKYDTLITFDISAHDTFATKQYHDQVAVLVEAADEISNKAYFSDRVARVFAYNANSPYAADLIDCVYSNSLISSCTLSQTPLIANEVNSNSVPSVESIMDRVVVSHQWMGDRFKAFLTNRDPYNDIKNLLRATTAIVIAYDIRPSFYWAATGAIYLDAENFWLIPQERDTINEAPDYRADFGNDLQFVMPWRYVKDNDYASQRYSKSARVVRSDEDALYRLTSLMYHELAHANDFFPSTEWYVHDSNKRVLDAATSTDFESDQLAIAMPLLSQEMRDLAQVSFAGESATAEQIAYLPGDIEAFFSPDRASDYYAYSSEREDYALLFEELMMQSRYGIFRDVAITNQPKGNNISGNDYIVTWGQRGRIGDDKLIDRVLFSASRVLPEFDSQAAMSSVEAPIEMNAGQSWLDNLTISPQIRQKLTKPEKMIDNASTTMAEQLAKEQFHHEIAIDYNSYYQKPLPKH